MILKKFEDCLFVDGYKRSLIIDLTRNHYEAIPKSLSLFVTNYNNFEKKHIEEICKSEWRTVAEYIEFLIKKEYCFFADDLFSQSFPPVNLDWDSPFMITNSIIEVKSNFEVSKTIQILSWVKCTEVEVRVNKNASSTVVKEFLRALDNSLVNSISLVFPFSEFDSIIGLKLHNYLKINSLLCYHVDSTKDAIKILQKNNPMVNFFDSKLDDIIKKRKKNHFRVNIKTVTESQKNHTYFNRKLYIGIKGEIKNSPECTEEFGFIKNMKTEKELVKTIDQSNFKSYWFVNKEICDVCKDCEFRNICIDNRLPTQRKDKSWYHLEECNYNPYLCKWKDEEGYQTLAQCEIISNETEFSINHQKVTEINKNLWGEE